jgi:hypothetical protein
MYSNDSTDKLRAVFFILAPCRAAPLAGFIIMPLRNLLHLIQVIKYLK